jgi:hypothetical protein
MMISSRSNAENGEGGDQKQATTEKIEGEVNRDANTRQHYNDEFKALSSSL